MRTCQKVTPTENLGFVSGELFDRSKILSIGLGPVNVSLDRKPKFSVVGAVDQSNDPPTENLGFLSGETLTCEISSQSEQDLSDN